MTFRLFSLIYFILGVAFALTTAHPLYGLRRLLLLDHRHRGLFHHGLRLDLALLLLLGHWQCDSLNILSVHHGFGIDISE